MTTITMTPTAEQDAAIGLFLSGRNLAVEAGAGTGKTSTLKLMAAHAPRRNGQYVAFNRAIVDDTAASLAREGIRSLSARTVHSIAMSQEGRRFRHRLGGRRLPTQRQVALLGVEPIKIRYGAVAKMLQPGFLVGRVMDALRNFCQSADPEPTTRHFTYIEGIDEPAGEHRGHANNRIVAEQLLPALKRAWRDATNPDGQLRYEHAFYLKLWQLSDPHIAADYVMFDEAQDASPVMLSIVEQQADHAQLIYVGDSQQQIYAWLGAVNALARLQDCERTQLTQSFRFGQAIADVANDVLDRLDADLRIVGNPDLDSVVVDAMTDPDAVLTRTNAEAVERLLTALDADRKPHLVGGGDDVLRFARAVVQLKTEGWTSYPDLACFSTWQQVQDYVDQDEQGRDLALMVRLVDRFDPEIIIDALEHQVAEGRADVVLSTAHKSKGRQWGRVMLGNDFPEAKPDQPLDPGELRLLYVAATRAQHELDVTSVAELRGDDVGPAVEVMDPDPVTCWSDTGQDADTVKEDAMLP
jgi:superfamily I DNA/RNA helicase